MGYPTQEELEKRISRMTPGKGITRYLATLPRRDGADRVVNYVVRAMLGDIEPQKVQFISLMESCAMWIDTKEFNKDKVARAMKRLQRLEWEISYPSCNTQREARNSGQVIVMMDTGIGYKIVDLYKGKKP